MKNQKHRLEKLTNEIDATKREGEKLRVTNEQQKAYLLEIQIQMKNIIQLEEFLEDNVFSCFHCFSFKDVLILYHDEVMYQ